MRSTPRASPFARRGASARRSETLERLKGKTRHSYLIAGVDRVLGLEVDDTRIGMAVIGPSGVIAVPLPALARTDEWNDARGVVDTAGREEAVQIVVGLPISLRGSLGPQAQKVLRFCETLRSATSLPVETSEGRFSWDGRFSRIEAENRLRAAGMRPVRDPAVLDSYLAVDILQEYLDAQTSRRGRARTVRV